MIADGKKTFEDIRLEHREPRLVYDFGATHIIDDYKKIQVLQGRGIIEFESPEHVNSFIQNLCIAAKAKWGDE